MMNRYCKIFLLVLVGFASIIETVRAQVDFREETIYFLLTTRFFDGDSSNNVPNEWSSYHPDPAINPSITDPDDVTWRGDFKGLIQQLDYIQDMGFTAIWITPIVHNRSPLDYHGYHAWDFTRVDPRLESPGATFQDLINEVHARGMKLVLDIVTNHTGRFGVKGHAEMKYNTDPTRPWGHDKDGNPLQDNPDWEYDGITPNPDDGKIWSRANLAKLPAPYNENQAAYNWPNTVTYVNTSDPDWWHHSGNGFAQGYDDTENLYYRALHEDTPDLNTGSPVVREYMVNAYKTFIEMGVDGFRWDTIKHMSREDVLWFLDAFKAINPDLFIFGEVAQKRHELHNVEEINPHWYTWRGAVNNSEPSGMSVLDFYAMATFHLFEKGENFSNVMAAARYDHLYSDPSHLVTFLDNHDFGPNNDWNRRYGGNAQNLVSALNFMWTWRGIPSLYYGTEIQFMRGAYADIQYGGHQRSIDETGRAYFGNHIADAPNHTVYQHIRKLNAIRRQVPALQKGTWRWGGSGGSNGVGIVREYGDSYAVVGLAKDGQVNFNFTGIRNGTYRDAVTGHEVTVSNGALQFTVAPGSAGIYVLDGPGLIGDLGAGFFQTDANGSQGNNGNNGGNGGTQTPATIQYDPVQPVAGQSLIITYDGFLNPQAQVNIHWGINNWQNVSTTAMQKSGEIWQVTLQVPASATRLDFVFNNGSGTWDNNNGSDYTVNVSGSGNGENGGNGTSGPVRWSPAAPTINDIIQIEVDAGKTGRLHWAVNGWQLVNSVYRPSGSQVMSDGVAVQTPMQGPDDNVLTLSIGPFNNPAQQVTEINFVISYNDGTWDNNNSADYRIPISNTTSLPLSSDLPSSLQLHQNYPNPFNPVTRIDFSLPESGQVDIRVYDLMGREVANMASGVFAAGEHSVLFDASRLSSGVYIYRMEASGMVITRRMTLLQ